MISCAYNQNVIVRKRKGFLVIEDYLHGETRVHEPIFREIIFGKDFQRLPGVSNLGLPDVLNQRPGFSSWDHSLGVFAHARKLERSLEEQIAWLTHDLSRFSFGHVIDTLSGTGEKQNLHDLDHAEFLEERIGSLLHKYGFDAQRIGHPDLFPLIDSPLPAVDADRFDYALREGYVRGLDVAPKSIIASLKVRGDRFYFDEAEAARSFASIYSRLNEESWTLEKNVHRYLLFSSMLQRGMDLGLIVFSDFRKKREEEILRALYDSGDPRIHEGLILLENGFNVIPGRETTKHKMRRVNPLVRTNGRLVQLSSLDNSFSIPRGEKGYKVYSIPKTYFAIK